MVGRSIDVKNDPFCPQQDDVEILGFEVPYLSVIGALIHLTNCICPNIVFLVNLLVSYCSESTKRHWNGLNMYYITLVE